MTKIFVKTLVEPADLAQVLKWMERNGWHKVSESRDYEVWHKGDDLTVDVPRRMLNDWASCYYYWLDEVAGRKGDTLALHLEVIK
jgi:hypothetical protein